MHIEKIYYYEVTFRHSGKSTQNGVPSLHVISHKWYLKKFLKLTNPHCAIGLLKLRWSYVVLVVVFWFSTVPQNDRQKSKSNIFVRVKPGLKC